jgi:tubulin--tyrosine ligase-like protein 12
LEVTYCPDCTRACKYDAKAVVGNGEIVEACNMDLLRGIKI